MKLLLKIVLLSIVISAHAFNSYGAEQECNNSYQIQFTCSFRLHQIGVTGRPSRMPSINPCAYPVAYYNTNSNSLWIYNNHNPYSYIVTDACDEVIASGESDGEEANVPLFGFDSGLYDLTIIIGDSSFEGSFQIE